MSFYMKHGLKVVATGWFRYCWHGKWFPRNSPNRDLMGNLRFRSPKLSMKFGKIYGSTACLPWYGHCCHCHPRMLGPLEFLDNKNRRCEARIVKIVDVHHWEKWRSLMGTEANEGGGKWSQWNFEYLDLWCIIGLSSWFVETKWYPTLMWKT